MPERRECGPQYTLTAIRRLRTGLLVAGKLLVLSSNKPYLPGRTSVPAICKSHCTHKPSLPSSRVLNTTFIPYPYCDLDVGWSHYAISCYPSHMPMMQRSMGSDTTDRPRQSYTKDRLNPSTRRSTRLARCGVHQWTVHVTQEQGTDKRQWRQECCVCGRWTVVWRDRKMDPSCQRNVGAGMRLRVLHDVLCRRILYSTWNSHGCN